ncbi:MAG: DUF2892 domain-containing protein [Ignavibacteriales bacterium]|nr:DUF2892 domain-containing protein [Ignavibacteriales bacterium]
MKKNVGDFDKVLRLVLGLVIIALGILFQSWWGLLGVILLFSASTGRCPLYLPFGLSTCKVDPNVKK